MEFSVEDCGWGLGRKVRVFEGRAGGLNRKRAKSIVRRYSKWNFRSVDVLKENQCVSLDTA